MSIAGTIGEKPDNTPFFVVGSDRSGTTMFRLMLNEHSRIHIPRESWFIIPLMDNLPLKARLSPGDLEQAFTIISTHKRWRDWESSDHKLREVIFSLGDPTLAELVDEVFRQCGNTSGKPRWGDKTPKYIDEVTRLHELFPGARFIHIVRDGRDVCNSLRRFRWQGESVYSIAEYWRDVIHAGKAAGRLLGPELYLEIFYEELVLNPEKVLRTVCSFLREDYEASMLDFHEHADENVAEFEKKKGIHAKTSRAPKASDTHRWKTEMKPAHVAMFEAFAGSAMDLVGQQRKFRGPALVFPLMYRWLVALIKFTRPARQRLGIQFPTLRRKM